MHNYLKTNTTMNKATLTKTMVLSASMVFILATFVQSAENAGARGRIGHIGYQNSQKHPRHGNNQKTEIVKNNLEVKSIDTAAKTFVVNFSGSDFTVVATGTTSIVRNFGAKADFSEIMAGDFVNIKGTYDPADASRILAKNIKDTSIQLYRGTFRGKVVSVDTDGKKFVLAPVRRSEQTVMVLDTTVFKKAGALAAFSDLASGTNAVVRGTWNKTHSLVYNTTLVKILP
jgi:hypothetical protein